jgi:CO/xanthine dehydrogenase FAD-binding subunit
MPTRSRAYHRPAGLAEAVAILGEDPAGSAPLLLGPRPPVGVFPDRAHLVDIADLALTGISEAGAGRLSLGAALPLQAFIEDPRLSTLADGVLAEAARFACHLGLRHVATLGGALLDPTSPPEIGLVLLALQASVVTLGKARHETQLMNFAPTPGELPIAVTLAGDPAQRGALMRVARSPRDRAIVAAVAVLIVTGEVCRDGRLAVAGASPQPLCLTAAELGLAGQALTPERGANAAEAVRQASRPVGDYLGSAAYRREMAGVLTGRALAGAWRRAQS